MRPTLTWTIALGGLLLLAGAMAWATRSLVGMEQNQNRMAAEAAIQERSRLALWRMESLAAALVIEESARPPGQFHTADPAFAPPASPDGRIRLHFEMDADGRIRSPQTAAGPDKNPVPDEPALRLQELRARLAAKADPGQWAQLGRSTSLDSPADNRAWLYYANSSPPSAPAAEQLSILPQESDAPRESESKNQPPGNPQESNPGVRRAKDSQNTGNPNPASGQSAMPPPPAPALAPAPVSMAPDPVPPAYSPPQLPSSQKLAEARQDQTNSNLKEASMRQRAAQDLAKVAAKRYQNAEIPAIQTTGEKFTAPTNKADSLSPVPATLAERDSAPGQNPASPTSPTSPASSTSPTPPTSPTSPTSPSAEALAQRTLVQAKIQEQIRLRDATNAAPAALMPPADSAIAAADPTATRAENLPPAPPAGAAPSAPSAPYAPAAPASAAAPAPLSAATSPVPAAAPATTVGTDLMDSSHLLADSPLPAKDSKAGSLAKSVGSSTAPPIPLTSFPASNPDAPPPPAISDFRAFWIKDALLLTRRVSENGSSIIQGAWVDWPLLRRDLLTSISDLFPAATLDPAPASDGGGTDLLASLPIKFSPGPLSFSPPDFWSPLKMSLATAWACVLLATAAVFLVLRGMMTLSERRATFVSAVTHELRTPLATFKLYSEMLADGLVKDPAKRQSYLETLTTEADRLGHLVENVLSYSRLERGNPKNGSQGRIPTTLRDLRQRVEPRLHQRTAQAGAAFTINQNDLPADLLLTTDPAAVEQILFNLVDNACKYGGALGRLATEGTESTENIKNAARAKDKKDKKDKKDAMDSVDSVDSVDSEDGEDGMNGEEETEIGRGPGTLLVAAAPPAPRIEIHFIKQSGFLAIRVCDHGRGLTRAEARKLFRPFHKSAREAAHSAPGVGLGLALCRRLARDLGGALTIDHTYSQGACFTLTLPL